MENQKKEEQVVKTEKMKSTQTVVVSKESVDKKQASDKSNASKNEAKTFKRKPGFAKKDKTQFQSEFEEKVIDIARVTTVVKGERRFSFSAYAVVGNKKGKVGYGHGKANEVQDAIKKAVKDAQNRLITVPIVNKSTIPHEISEKFLASKVLLKPAPKGKGIIASNTVRAVVELAGYTDIYTKTHGSRTKINTVHATIKALQKLRTVEDIAWARDIEVEKLTQN